MQARAAVTALCLGLVGCAAPNAQVHRVWLPSYFFGAFGGGDLDTRDYCDEGRVAELSLGSSGRTLAVSFATLGIYTPREARIRCAAPR